MIRRALLSYRSFLNSFFHSTPSPQFALCEMGAPTNTLTNTQNASPTLADCLWMAVPKRKVTPGKKRMKTTNQKRIKKKNHIIVDQRTGEITLRHRLPFNWKDYLPGN